MRKTLLFTLWAILILAIGGIALIFSAIAKFIGRYPDNKIIALFLSSLQYIQMSNMKHIEHTRGVTDFILFLRHFTLPTFLQTF